MDHLLFPVDIYCLPGMIFIVDTNLNFSAFSCQFCRRYFFAVQIVGKFYGNRKFGIGSSLIVNIISVGGPGDGAVTVLGKCFVTFDVLDILQGSVICQ